jgi:hypothetical protein
MPRKCRHTIRVVRGERPDVVQCTDCDAVLPATAYFSSYEYVYDGAGIVLRRLRDGNSLFLQGDDATRFIADVEPLKETQYPYGPFSCYEEHLDYLIGQYSEQMKGGTS